MNIVVSGPGGVGKGTIVDRLLERNPSIWLSRSWTTRAPRPGESPDAYVFTDRATFDGHVEAGGFLEWVDFLDYRQGTPVPTPPPGVDVLFEIDVHGAAAIREVDHDALLVFVDAPDRDAQRLRLEKRGDPPERVQARLAKGDEERTMAATLPMVPIVNDDLDRAVIELEAIIAAHRTGGQAAAEG